MKMLTARLTDEEMARLKELAGDEPVVSLLRKWIGVPPPVKTVWTSPVDGPQAAGAVVPEHLIPPARRPAFLAAPNDDCAACGHDRQSYHLGGPCRFPTGRKTICACPEFATVMFDD